MARDALLARDAGARVHICHASTAGTVEILRWAKEQGIAITAEVTPHHLMLDDSRLVDYDGRDRVNPCCAKPATPTRCAARWPTGHRLRGHRPRPARRTGKCCEFSVARPGMLGLQTALSVVAATMVGPGLLNWRGVAEVMSVTRRASWVWMIRAVRWRSASRPTSSSSTRATPGPSTARRWQTARPTPRMRAMTLPATVTATLLRGRISARDGRARR